MNSVTQMPQVVVVGGGFAGLAAAGELAKEGFRVTLIDRAGENTLQPLLAQVATGSLGAADVSSSLRLYAAEHEGVNFRHAELKSIDHLRQQLVCADGSRLDFDYLV